MLLQDCLASSSIEKQQVSIGSSGSRTRETRQIAFAARAVNLSGAGCSSLPKAVSPTPAIEAIYVPSLSLVWSKGGIWSKLLIFTYDKPFS
jgi:hypothetical protein